ncbi:MAG: ABC transporter ATP-binding protein [Phormidesmis sp.]
MSNTVVRVENLGKRYKIGSLKENQSYTALRDILSNGIQNITKRFSSEKILEKNIADEGFWALDNISFKINQGDRVGIIGHNGAGKSTLLKVLSRITEPTKGRIHLKGRVASLLEVGTGFHPELTGRENIYLNGAILGMEKIEIVRKFDEIVAFAEVEKFLDMPVKRYSSGMYVRLAFAVAAHLEPEILIVDEVLAVGDGNFQKKCIGKMEEVSKSGRTILFVSHNMSTVKQLCSRAIVLNKGCIDYDGTPQKAIEIYAESGIQKFTDSANSYKHISGNQKLNIDACQLNSLVGECFSSVFENITISLDYSVSELAANEKVKEVSFFVLIYSMDGEVQASLFQRDSDSFIVPSSNCGTVNLEFKNCLLPGKYMVSAGIFDHLGEFVDWVECVGFLNIESCFVGGKKFDSRLGRVSLVGSWTHDAA